MTLSFFDPVRKYLRLWPSRIQIVLFLFIATTAVLSQPPKQLAKIMGTVRDPNGKTISSVRIVLSDMEDNAKQLNVITDANGGYVFTNLRYGTYTLATIFSGYSQSEPKSLTVTSATTTVDLTLTPRPRTGGAHALESGSVHNMEKQAPIFTPAGVQGTIAPSGYSAAASEEEASQVLNRVGDIGEETLPSFAFGETIPTCDHEADLLKTAQMHPESFVPNHALGIFYLSQGNLPQGIRYLKLALEANPADANNSHDLALAYMGMKQYSDAIALLQRKTEKQSSNASLLRLLAVAYEASGDLGNSAKEYLRAAALDTSAPSLVESGFGLIRQGATGDAVNLFTSATVTYPGSAILWTGLGIAQDLQQHKEDAIRSLIKSINLDPEYLQSYSFLANLYGTSTDTDAEIKRRLDGLLVSHPESALAHYDYALVLWKQRRLQGNPNSLEEIETQLQFAIAKDPKLSRAHFQLGVIYASSGDYVSAARELRVVVQLEPRNPEAHYRLAQAYRRTKQTAFADAELKQFQVLKSIGTTAKADPGMGMGMLIPQMTLHISQAAPCQQTNH